MRCLVLLALFGQAPASAIDAPDSVPAHKLVRMAAPAGSDYAWTVEPLDGQDTPEGVESAGGRKFAFAGAPGRYRVSLVCLSYGEDDRPKLVSASKLVSIGAASKPDPAPQPAPQPAVPAAPDPAPQPQAAPRPLTNRPAPPPARAPEPARPPVKAALLYSPTVISAFGVRDYREPEVVEAVAEAGGDLSTVRWDSALSRSRGWDRDYREHGGSLRGGAVLVVEGPGKKVVRRLERGDVGDNVLRIARTVAAVAGS